MATHCIINLSSIHPTHWLGHFASLLAVARLEALAQNPADKDLIDNPQSLHAQRLTFTHLRGVIQKYRSAAMQDLIKQYKLGTIDNNTFIEALLETHFPKLKDVEFPERFISQLRAREMPYLSVDTNVRLTNYEVAKMCLEDAWAARIQPFDNSHRFRLNRLYQFIQARRINEITLISNSNPIDVHRALHYLQRVSDFNFTEGFNLAKISTRDGGILDVGTWNGCKVKLAASFNMHAFKTPGQNALATTPGILNNLLADRIGTYDTFYVISQFAGDRTAARKQGLRQQNIHDANLLGYARTLQPSMLALGSLCGMLMAYGDSVSAVYMTMFLLMFGAISAAIHGRHHPVSSDMLNFAVGNLAGMMFFNTLFASPLSAAEATPYEEPMPDKNRLEL